MRTDSTSFIARMGISTRIPQKLLAGIISPTGTLSQSSLFAYTVEDVRYCVVTSYVEKMHRRKDTIDDVLSWSMMAQCQVTSKWFDRTNFYCSYYLSYHICSLISVNFPSHLLFSLTVFISSSKEEMFWVCMCVFISIRIRDGLKNMLKWTVVAHAVGNAISISI